jgi:CDP-diacylglycerol--glycerol-3-phosphate 3-phosphatidyltransferase
MNLPNKLTIFRILLVPVMVIIPYLNISGTFLNISIEYWIMGLIFVIASYTDHLDGKLARKNNQITAFGKFADPLADKILVLAAMLIFVEAKSLPAWIPIIVLFREFVVIGIQTNSCRKRWRSNSSKYLGKTKNSNTNDCNNINVYKY